MWPCRRGVCAAGGAADRIARGWQAIEFKERREKEEAEARQVKEEDARQAAEANKFANLPKAKQDELKAKARGARGQRTGRICCIMRARPAAC